MRGGTGDTDWIAEVVRRRFARYLDDQVEAGADADTDPAAEAAEAVTAPAPAPGIDALTGRPRRFAYPPNLLVVDGGAPQVAAAQAVFDDLGIDDVALAGLAKRLEEVWRPGEAYPTILPRTSEGLYLLQRVRDEAHRFAITFHREKRSKAMTTSVLDDVPGLGPARRKALLAHFGSVRRLRAAGVDELVAVPGIGRHTAETIVEALRTDASSGQAPMAGPAPAAPGTRTGEPVPAAINMSTGEILDEPSGEEPA